MVEPVKKLKFKCGTITIFPPEKVPDNKDKEQLYQALLECMIDKSPKPKEVQEEANEKLAVR